MAVRRYSFHQGKLSPIVWLSLSLAAHLLAIRLWPGGQQQWPSPPAPPIAVRLMTLPEPERKIKPVETAPAQATRHEHAPPTPRPAAPAAEAKPQAVPPAPASPASPPVRDSEQLILDARRSAGRIDHELRRDFPFATQAPSTSKLERGIAAAARPERSSLAEKTLPDGRRITKVSGPGGTYCVIEGNVGTPGGVQQRTTSCDHLFD